MAILDNSGDIILDAVLTDLGRQLLAKGDGSFQVAKFALGDEEINYALYNKTHASGSSYYDLEIMQTPILEAFTDNVASMKTRLQTYSNLELLFLPEIRLNEQKSNNKRHSTGAFLVCADLTTEDNDGSETDVSGVGRDSSGLLREGFVFGESLKGTVIRLDQGLNTKEISPRRRLSAELYETSYIVQMDNRLGALVDLEGNVATPDYIDDDNISFYTVDMGDNFVKAITDESNGGDMVIAGPRGTMLAFRIQASVDLNTSTYLFTTLGATTQLLNRNSDGVSKSTCYYIDTNVRCVGTKTGSQIDIPIRYLKVSA